MPATPLRRDGRGLADETLFFPGPAEAPVEGPDDFDLPPGGGMMIGDALHHENDDGSVDIDLEPRPALGGLTGGHGDNLAEIMRNNGQGQDVDRIVAEIIEGIDNDRESQKEYMDSLSKGIELLGLKYEDKSYPFQGACGVYDPLLLEGVIRGQATARGELLPAAGPVKAKIVGVRNEEILGRAERVVSFMNLFFTEMAPEYYEDRDQMFMWLWVCGSTLTKIYTDPILGRPVGPFITPHHFIAAYATTDLETSPRFTQEQVITRREMKLRQLKGLYSRVELAEPDEAAEPSKLQDTIDKTAGIRPSIMQKDNRHTVYESYVDLDLPGFEHVGADGNMTGLPLPYRVSIDRDSQKCLEIRRNWKEGDADQKRIVPFVHHKLLPGLGFFGMGYAHALGGHARTRTMLVRQLVDCGTLNLFPGGVRAKGARMEQNNMGIGPTEFREIDLAGLQSVKDTLMLMPYPPPSEVTLELYRDVGTQQQRLGSTAEIAVGEGRQDAPVGTTAQLMEAALRPQTGILKRLHNSMHREFVKFRDELRDGMEPGVSYPFAVEGREMAIMRDDFSKQIDVIPVSDPNVASSSQRMMRAEAILHFVQSAPDIHNRREAYRRVYTAMGEENPEQLLPPPQQAVPLDPVSENQMAIRGEQLAVGDYQDHDAHIQAHSLLMDQPTMAAHVSEHLAQKYRQIVQQAIGIPLPPMGTQMPPEIENEIARLVAQATDAIRAQVSGGAAGGMDPMAVALEDVRVKAASVQQKAHAAKLDASTKAFQAFLDFQSKAADRVSREKTTKLRVYADLADNRVQQPGGIPPAAIPQ